jgi:hypothetical protein
MMRERSQLVEVKEKDGNVKYRPTVRGGERDREKESGAMSVCIMNGGTITITLGPPLPLFMTCSRSVLALNT